ncbi:alpha/beta fold hydrolase [Streptomyces sp. NPDC055056]
MLEVCEELDLQNVTFVGHSVSAMVGVLAAAKAPQRLSRLVMVAPSPCYIDDEGYRGGFSAEDIDELLQSLESNYLGWSAAWPRGQLLVLDLARLDFCDSSGISALLSARSWAIQHGGRIALAAVPGNTARILGIVGLDQVFAIHPDAVSATSPNTAAG